MTSTILFEDRFGEIIDRPADELIEIRWYDSTTELDAGTFQQWLLGFVAAVEQSGRTRVLTDSSVFGMDMAHMSGDWRDANIIPRYNAAGVAKFAFVMPAGMPAIGSDPVKEGPADYLTAYFGTRQTALAWLAAK